MSVVSLLLVTHPDCAKHVAWPGHIERPARLGAALDGIADLDLGDDLITHWAEPASLAILGSVHDESLLEQLESLDAVGGGPIDPDTAMSETSWLAARLAAGAGLEAIDALGSYEVDAAITVVRPPGHHATARTAMGFCLLNNVAVAAKSLIGTGERVVILDFDAHHGNGTQDIFYDDPRVLFVSMHQYPFWPGSGAADEVGIGPGSGYTLNVPMPAGASGEAYRRAMDLLIEPVVLEFSPTWLLISAGFDGHRADSISSLGLTSGDFAGFVAQALTWVEKRRSVIFLEGGYDLRSLRSATCAVGAVLVDEQIELEGMSSGDVGVSQVDDLIAQRRTLGLLGNSDE